MSSRKRTRDDTAAPRYTETWLAILWTDPALTARAKVAAYALARHADWHTGGACWPSRPTLARESGMSEVSVKRALADLEAAGYIERTGINRPRNSTDYRLILPPEGDSVRSVLSVSQVNGDQTGESQSGQFGPPVRSVLSFSQVNGDLQPHLPPPTIGGGVEEESAEAPPPDGRDALRPAVDVAELLPTILPGAWDHNVDANDPDLGDALTALLAQGWTADNLRDACADIGKPKSSPTKLLTAHLRKWAGKRPPQMVRASAAAARATEQADPAIVAAAAKVLGWTKAQVAALITEHGAEWDDYGDGAQLDARGPDWCQSVSRDDDSGPGLFVLIGDDEWQDTGADRAALDALPPARQYEAKGDGFVLMSKHPATVTSHEQFMEVLGHTIRAAEAGAAHHRQQQNTSATA